VKTFQWDKYSKEAGREPFVLEGVPDWHPASDAQGGPGSLSIPVPSGEAFLEAEQAGSTRRSLELLCGEQWTQVWLLIQGDANTRDADKPPMTGLMALVQDITRHFSLGEENRPPVAGRR
jgi:hypothetical protein